MSQDSQELRRKAAQRFAALKLKSSDEWTHDDRLFMSNYETHINCLVNERGNP